MLQLPERQLLIALIPAGVRGSVRTRENKLPFQLSVKGVSDEQVTPWHEDHPSETLVKLSSEAVLD